MYSKKVLERFQNPNNAGNLKGANAVGQVGNANCGDIMKMYLKIDNNGIIQDAKFKTFGCCVAIASTDIACDLIKGKSIEDALKITNIDIIENLGELPQHKIHCSILAEDVIRKTISDFYKRKERETKAEIKRNQ